MCILHHIGWIQVEDEEPNDFEAVSVYFRVQKGKNNYPSVEMNGIKSKKRTHYEGHSLKPERLEYLPYMGNEVQLAELAMYMPTLAAGMLPKSFKRKPRSGKVEIACNVNHPSLCYNLSMELSNVFCLSQFADRGEYLCYRTSNKHKDHILIIETPDL